MAGARWGHKKSPGMRPSSAFQPRRYCPSRRMGSRRVGDSHQPLYESQAPRRRPAIGSSPPRESRHLNLDCAGSCDTHRRQRCLHFRHARKLLATRQRTCPTDLPKRQLRLVYQGIAASRARRQAQATNCKTRGASKKGIVEPILSARWAMEAINCRPPESVHKRSDLTTNVTCRRSAGKRSAINLPPRKCAPVRSIAQSDRSCSLQRRRMA